MGVARPWEALASDGSNDDRRRTIHPMRGPRRLLALFIADGYPQVSISNIGGSAAHVGAIVVT